MIDCVVGLIKRSILPAAITTRVSLNERFNISWKIRFSLLVTFDFNVRQKLFYLKDATGVWFVCG